MLKRFTVCLFLLAGLVTFSFAADENQNACKGDPEKWQQLFNGKDLTGWKHVGPGNDTVEDGSDPHPWRDGLAVLDGRQNWKLPDSRGLPDAR